MGDGELALWKAQNEKFLETMGEAFDKAVLEGIPWLVNNYCLKCEYRRTKCTECSYQIARRIGNGRESKNMEP